MEDKKPNEFQTDTDSSVQSNEANNASIEQSTNAQDVNFTMHSDGASAQEEPTMQQESNQDTCTDAAPNTKTQQQSETQTHTQEVESAPKQTPPLPPKEPFTKRHRTPLLIAGCLLVGGIGGFGGAYLSTQVYGGTGQTVLYQAVERTDEDGASITNMSVKDIVANTSKSVVEITTESAATDSYFQQMITTGAGSGVIISKDGYIVTNNHVVDGANKITVRTKDGTEYSATLIGKDATTDLAVIKIEASDLSAAVMGSSNDLSVGDDAIAIGNPLGELGGTVTRGIISALDREITIDGQSMTLLQTDTAINKGNSGGGLFNSNGELIGIVNAKSSGTSVEGLGFAIPIDTAKPVIESLISNGYVTGRPQLGVSMVNIEDDKSAFQAGVNEFGVYIAKVNSGSAAEEAGLKVKDRVISVDGQEVSSSSEIAKIVNSKKVGDSLNMVVERDGQQVNITATLKEAQETSSNNEDSQNSNRTPDSNQQNQNGFGFYE